MADTYSTLPVRETSTEAKVFEKHEVSAGGVKLSDGTVIPSSDVLVIGTIKQRQLIVEKRGFTSRPSVPEGSASVETYVDFTFEQKNTQYEASRINEAGFWRLTKTVTIQALYIGINKVKGKTEFDTGDDTIK